MKRRSVLALLSAGSDANDYALEAFPSRTARPGFTEEENLAIKRQVNREGSEESLARAAKALAGWSPDVVPAANTPPAKTMSLAAPNVPIVMMAIGDPVGSGLVASLAKPGGRTTGLSGLDAELTGKRLELLKEVAPGTTRVGLARTCIAPRNSTTLLPRSSSVAARRCCGSTASAAPTPCKNWAR